MTGPSATPRGGEECEGGGKLEGSDGHDRSPSLESSDEHERGESLGNEKQPAGDDKFDRGGYSLSDDKSDRGGHSLSEDKPQRRDEHERCEVLRADGALRASTASPKFVFRLHGRRMELLVRFDAWRHEKREQLWGTFSIEFLSGVAARQGLFCPFTPPRPEGDLLTEDLFCNHDTDAEQTASSREASRARHPGCKLCIWRPTPQCRICTSIPASTAIYTSAQTFAGDSARLLYWYT